MRLIWIECLFCALSLCFGCGPGGALGQAPDYTADVAAEAAALSLTEPAVFQHGDPESRSQPPAPAPLLASASSAVKTTVSKAEFLRRSAKRCSGGSCGMRRAGTFRGGRLRR